MYYTETDSADVCRTLSDVDKSNYYDHEVDDIKPVVNAWWLLICDASGMVDYE